MVEIIAPNIDCKACKGRGLLSGGLVPYGSTTANLPDEYCGCVLDQVQNDDSEIEIDDEQYWIHMDSFMEDHSSWFR
jgi:hypothetical protein